MGSKTRQAVTMIGLTVMLALPYEQAIARPGTTRWQSGPSAAELYSAHLQTQIQRELLQEQQSQSAHYHQPFALMQLYRARQFQAIWTHPDTAPNPAALELLTFIQKLPSRGLNPAHYHLNDIQDRLQAKNMADQLRLELALSDAFLALSGDLHQGLDWHSQRDPDLQAVHLLLQDESQSHPGRALGLREPQHPHYLQLVAALDQELRLHGSQERIRSLQLTLERWRQQAPAFSPPYIRVNIPAQRLWFHGMDQQFSMKVIIGQAEHPSPSLRSHISEIVFNPDWAVPRRIAAEKILPKLQKDPSYLQSARLSVHADWSPASPPLDTQKIVWSKIPQDELSYVFRQAAGPGNALGRVKFLFPNPYQVYLHDTPNHSLFERDDRRLSAGCIRLQEPLRLAEALLPYSQKPEQSVSGSLDQGDSYRVQLTQAIAVYLDYHRVWIDPDGHMNWSEDVYGEDRALERHLAQHPAWHPAWPQPVNNDFPQAPALQATVLQAPALQAPALALNQ